MWDPEAHDPAGPDRTPPAGDVPPPFSPAAGPWPWPTSPGASPEPPAPRRWRRRALVAALAASVLGAGALGGLIGHELGPPASSAASRSSSVSPGTGTSPFGGGSGTLPFGGGTLPFGGGISGGPPYASPIGGSGSGSSGSSASGPADASSIAARVDPGLVEVNTTIDYGAAEGAATGMVLTPSGEVLTNNHVVEGATSITVTDVGNGRTYGATVVGYDRSQDVAVLQLTGASGLVTVTTGNSAQVAVGEEVVAIGNANGAGGTPSYAGGTITALDQSISASDDLTGTSERLSGMIETNADIVAGDSGGPLVNSSGQVIGMDTAGSGTFQFAPQSSGNGFAIPIDTALAIAREIEAGQASATVHVGATAFLGVDVQASTPGTSGVTVVEVVPGSPAAAAGLGEGDVITSLGGHVIGSYSSLTAVLTQDEHPGESARLTYTDPSGQQHTATVTLASGPAQ